MYERTLSDDLEQVEQFADRTQKQIARLREIEDAPTNVGPHWRPAALLRLKFEEQQMDCLALRNSLLERRWHMRPCRVRVVNRQGD